MWRTRGLGLFLAAVMVAACSSSGEEPALLPGSDASPGAIAAGQNDEFPTGNDTEPPPAESLERPGPPDPAVDEAQDPSDDAAALAAAEHLEERGGIIDFATSVDGETTSVTTLLTTDQGTVRRTTTATGLEYTEVLTVADPGELATFTYSSSSGFPGTEDREYRDGAGYLRSGDDEVIDDSTLPLPPWRTIQPMESFGSIDDPLPLTGATFDWGEYVFSDWSSIYDVGEAWTVEIGGMVEPDILPTATEDGRCVLLYGTATSLTLARAWRSVAEDYDPPEPGLVVDGEIRTSDGTVQLDGGRGLQCDVLPAFEQGYTLTHTGGSTVGETIPFYGVWFVPEGSTIDAVAIGDWNLSSGDLTTAYFSIDIIDTIEPPVRGESPYRYLTEARAKSSDSVAHVGGGAEWTVDVERVVTLPITETLVGGEFAECYAIVGTATLEAVISDDGVDGIGRPGLIADGLHRQGGRTDCDTSSLEAEGYASRRSFADGMAVGDTRGFFDTLYVEKRLSLEWITLENLGGTLILELP